MKNLFFAITVLAGGTAFSQNTVPDNGKVGLGTTTPEQQLHVKGNVQIDSNVYINKHVSIGGALEVGQKARFERLEVSGTLDATAKSRFNDTVLVEKEVYLNGPVQSNLSFTGNGKNEFNGEAAFHSNVVLSSLGGLTDPTTSHFLFVNADNKVVKSSIPTFADGLATAIYSLPCLSDVNGNVLSPKWNNGPNKIYALCANVGIGTNTPLYKLDVRGQGYFEKGIHIGTSVPSNEIINSQALIDVETTSNNTPFIRLSHKTGTNAPQSRFRVENDGRVYCTSVWVSWADSIPVPDYVFKPGYQLMPLSELKSYLLINKHLPNIPGEAEIQTAGTNLQEMQFKLLEKVEELTLYVIELNESKDELKKKNEILMQEIEAIKKSISKN